MRNKPKIPVYSRDDEEESSSSGLHEPDSPKSMNTEQIRALKLKQIYEVEN